MKLTNKIKLLSSLCAASLLAACGDSTTVNTETGSFMKGQASGVIYTTETHTGVTDENGAYQYEPGENISFYIGGTQLGATVAAGAEIGPMDLVPGVTFPTAAKDVKQFLYDEGDDFGENASLDAQYELMNILIFLYSADKDKDASNGVMIDPALHVTFANNNYDLKIRASRFDNISGIERQFYEAYIGGGVDNARIIRRWKALDDFAALEGLAPQIYVRHTSEEDYDNDGTIDYSSVTSFDSRGLFSGFTNENNSYQVEFNDYGDAVSNTYTEMDGEEVDTYSGATTYDIHGNQLSSIQSENGEVTYAYYQTYDNYGVLTGESVDTDGDGAIDEINTFEFDAEGRILSLNRDSDADGVVDRIETWTYDSNGNQTSYIRDDGADGTPNYINLNTYDVNGYQTSRTYDWDGDGTIDTEYLYTYDANGNQLFYSYDGDADGTPNWTRTYTYDANGNQLTYHRDNNGDGTADRIYNYSYDANGNRLTYHYDSNADGTWDRIYVYTYDANGNRLTTSEDYDADGIFDYIETSTYDANGNELTYTEEEDGELTYSETWTYDADGNETSNTEDDDADGIIDYVRTYTWDEHGNRTQRAYDYDGDGVVDEISNYTYQLITFLGWYTYD